MNPWDLDSHGRERLECLADFVLEAYPGGLSMLPESDDLELIAGDGCGGCFYLWHAQKRGDKVPVVYLSEYGETSRFAEDFDAALTIAAAFPAYWCDILVAAHKGDEILSRALAHYEADPDYTEARAELCELLGLDPRSAASLNVEAVRTIPAFEPLLDCDGLKPPGSFKDRLAPA